MTVILTADPATHVPWMQQNQGYLVRNALDGYQQLGRGAIVLDLEDYDPQTDDYTATYHEAASTLLVSLGQQQPWTANAIQMYDPSSEIVVVLTAANELGEHFFVTYRLHYSHSHPLRLVSSA